MLNKISSYIFFGYFKYFINFLMLLLSLIWLSQFLRIIDVKFSISHQLIGVLQTTFFALPAYLNPLFPIIILISFVYFNFVLTSKSEIKIINQYLSSKSKLKLSFFFNLIILLAFYLNNEFVSPYFYNKYKHNEIDIRNNLKLGVPDNNNYNINNELSIFFETFEKNNFKKVEAIIIKENQFILSDSAEIEYDKQGFNINFINGIRIKMNEIEKSKTIFKKFTYFIKKNDLEILHFDKDHFNTVQLLRHPQKDFQIQGHNKIYHYLLIIVVMIISSLKLFQIFEDSLKQNSLYYFMIILLNYILNSYLLYKLNLNSITVVSYYIINILFMTISLISVIIKK